MRDFLFLQVQEGGLWFRTALPPDITDIIAYGREWNWTAMRRGNIVYDFILERLGICPWRYYPRGYDE